jgi:hypothetical protein
MTLREKEDDVFGKYTSQIVRDGALGRAYESVPRRLLVVLKEPNDESGYLLENGVDFRDFARDHKRRATWDNVARWSALFQNPSIDIGDIDLSSKESRFQYLQCTAVANLKKIPGASRSSYREISAAAKENWELLREQFQLYRPNLTIAGGVFGIIKAQTGRAEIPQSKGRFPYFKDEEFGVCIDFYHPQCRRSKTELFGFLRDQLTFHGFCDQRFNNGTSL